VTPAVLRAAMADPARHAQVTVRIAGYSARFVTLPPAVQEEMLRRIERGL
jgi:pyruvate-formate lyase